MKTSSSTLQSSLAEFLLGEIGLNGRRVMKNISGLTPREIDALPAGTETCDAPGGASLMPVMKMPVAEVLAGGYSVSEIAAAVRKSESAKGNNPIIHVTRERALTEAEYQEARKGYASDDAAREHGGVCRGAIRSFGVSLDDIRPDDFVAIHYRYVG